MSKAVRIVFAAIAVLVVVSACSRERTFRGHFVTAFEVSAFEPCGSSTGWWVTGNVGKLRLSNKVPPLEAFRIKRYVELRGRVSPIGSYGHLGGYQRELQVTKVLVVRPAASGDCAGAQPVSPN